MSTARSRTICQGYKLAVPAGNSQMRILWDKDCRDKPIFRDVLGRGRQAMLAIDQAFSHAKARRYLVGLGRALGYKKRLEWYDLRRTSGKKLHGKSAPFLPPAAPG